MTRPIIDTLAPEKCVKVRNPCGTTRHGRHQAADGAASNGTPRRAPRQLQTAEQPGAVGDTARHAGGAGPTDAPSWTEWYVAQRATHSRAQARSQVHSECRCGRHEQILCGGGPADGASGGRGRTGAARAPATGWPPAASVSPPSVQTTCAEWWGGCATVRRVVPTACA